MIWLIIALVLFLGIHSLRIVAPDWTAAKAAALGEGPWKGLYSLVSLAAFVLLVYGYGQARLTAPVLYDPPFWMGHITALLMLFAMIALAVYLLPAGRLKPMLKHPMLLAVKIWAFAHLLINGDLASVLLFGSFLAWAVLDRISMKRRNAAIATPGPVRWDIAALVTGVVLYGFFIWNLHLWLFGVVPMVTA